MDDEKYQEEEVEQEQVAETEQPAEEEVQVVDEPVAKSSTPTRAEVVGEITPEDLADEDLIEVMICMECGYVHKPGKGVAWCAACGGKTKPGLAKNKAAIMAEDEKRFQAPKAE